MPTRSRKVRRMRGSRTHGYGQVGQHRHSGKQGGHGQAGLHKHKWTWTEKFEPDHFGRDPIRPPRQTRPSKWINVGNLEALASAREAKTVEIVLAAMMVKELLGAATI